VRSRTDAPKRPRSGHPARTPQTEPTILRLWALAVLRDGGVVVAVEGPYYRPVDAHEAAALRLLSGYLVVPFTLRTPR
jgi:hypothetical protein